jgi:hypothetical protein
MGHIQKRTPERLKRLTDAIALGTTRTLACAYAGINIDTLEIWEKRYPEVKTMMLEAEARAVVGWLAKVERAANEGTWQAAAWKLERRYPEQYGRFVAGIYPAGAPDGAVPITRVILEVPQGEGAADARSVSDGGPGSDPFPAPRPIRRLNE